MNFLKTTFTVLVVLATLTFAAQPCNSNGKGEMGQGKCGMMNQIPNLSVDQMQKIDALCMETQKVVIERQAQIQIMRIELAELVDSQADKAKIDAKINDLTKLCSQVMKLRIETHQKVLQLLTDEQKPYCKFQAQCHSGGCMGMNMHGCMEGKKGMMHGSMGGESNKK